MVNIYLLYILIFWNNLFIDIKPVQLSIQLDKSKDLNINLYEIRLTEKLINNKELIQAYLFDCQCAVFLIDISNSTSFELIKEFLSLIDGDKYSYLKTILIENKLDLEGQKQVSGYEIKEFLDQNPLIQSESLSLKDGDSVQGLLDKIYKSVNESNQDLPINRVLVSQKNLSKTNEYEASISLILVGDTHVGKTNFLGRYIKNEFHDVFVSTVGIEREIKGIKIDNKLYKIIIWDTAGQERFRCLPRKYYKNVDGVLLLYDVCDEQSFKNVNNWVSDVEQNSNKESDISLFLLANKIDKDERVVTRERGEELAKSLGMKYFEISCKNNMNLHETVATMALECYRRVNPSANEGMKLAGAGKKNKKKCC